jgi:hypothetical protein
MLRNMKKWEKALHLCFKLTIGGLMIKNNNAECQLDCIKMCL